MKPILYEANERDFETNGIGVLHHCISCVVTEELNGSYELVMRYPIGGDFFKEIKTRRIILAKPNRSDETQPFRIYRITKPIKGVCTIYAAHISYDLGGIPIAPFSADTLSAVMDGFSDNSLVENPFSFWNDRDIDGELTFTTPITARAVIYDEEEGVLATYGGEVYCDRYSIGLMGKRGADRGVQIVYGKNLTDLNQEESMEEAYTGICPYAISSDGVLTMLPEGVVLPQQDFPYTKILNIDLSEHFVQEDGTIPTVSVDDLRTMAQWYVEEHDWGVPKISIDVSFVNLADTEEYKNVQPLEYVNIGDTITVSFADLGLYAKSRISKTVYNVLLEKYDSVVVGKVVRTLADSLAEAPTKSYVKAENLSSRVTLQGAIKHATELLSGANGGVVEILDENGDGVNDALIIRAEDSSHFIKMTKDGIGLTVDGGKSFTTAMTPDGIHGSAIIAKSITAEEIDANGLSIKDGSVDISGELGRMFTDKGVIYLAYTDSEKPSYLMLTPQGISYHDKSWADAASANPIITVRAGTSGSNTGVAQVMSFAEWGMLNLTEPLALGFVEGVSLASIDSDGYLSYNDIYSLEDLILSIENSFMNISNLFNNN